MTFVVFPFGSIKKSDLNLIIISMIDFILLVEHRAVSQIYLIGKENEIFEWFKGYTALSSACKHANDNLCRR
jgi:hypothetical protein